MVRLDDGHTCEIAEREPVRVGGDQPQASLRRHHEHPRQLRRSRVFHEGGPDDLAEPVGENGSGDLDPFLFRNSEPGDLRAESDPNDELGPAGGEAHVFVAGDDGHSAGLEGSHYVHDQAGRHESRAVGLAQDLTTSLDDEIWIGPAYFQLVPAESELQPGDAEARPGTSACRPRRGYEGLEESVTIGTKLHGMLYSFLIREKRQQE